MTLLVNMTLSHSTEFPTGAENESDMRVDETHTDVWFPEQTATLLIWKYCPPMLLLVGTFGNVATIVVYKRMKWGDSTQPLFLSMLAVADLSVLHSSLLPDITYHAFGFDIRGVHDILCKFLTWVTYSTAFMSSWLLAAMTTQRAMSVLWPHRVSAMCTFGKSGVIIVLIVVMAAGAQSHILWGLEVYESSVYLDGACAASEGYEVFWNDVWPWIDMSLFSLVPSLILLASNTVLVRSLRHSASSVSSMGSATLADSRKKMANAMTVTLISISITFLVLTLPIVIVIILWYLLSDLIESNAHLLAKMDLAWAITNMLWYANSAVNFVLYCLGGTRFREEFLRCFKCGRAASRANLGNSSQSTVVSYH